MTDTKTIILVDGATLLHFPPGSARGIACSISTVDSGELRRTVNGDLIDLTRPLLRKYTLSLSGDGVAMPSAHSMWRGEYALVAPPVTWTALADVSATAIHLPRAAVTGSLVLRDAVTGATLPSPTYDAATLEVVLPEREHIALLEYQPLLACRVVGRSEEHDEWGATVSWSLDLEEV